MQPGSHDTPQPRYLFVGPTLHRGLAANLRFVLLKTRRRCAQDGQVCVDENLGVDADRCRGMAGEHDEIVDPLRALGAGAQTSRG